MNGRSSNVINNHNSIDSINSIVAENITPLDTTSGRDTNESHCCSLFGSSSKSKKHNNISINTNYHLTTTTKKKTKKDSDDDDAMIAKELNKLSLDERNRLFDEIHGVGGFLEKESDDFVDELIPKFNAAMKGLPSSKRAAADKAFFLKPSLEANKKFKLMFLRADCYNPKLAAKRCALYFQNKLELWGESCLTRTITKADLTAEDMEIYGFFLLLPYKDNAGRSIWFSDFPKMNFDLPVKALLRVNWYIIMTTLEDEEAQLKGISNMQYFVGKFHPSFTITKFQKTMMKWSTVIPHMPVRVTSDHFCSDKIQMKAALHIMRAALGKFLQLRVRAHFGSGIEIQYSLMSYGIICPFLLNSDNSHNNPELDKLHEHYLKSRQVLEEKRRKKQVESDSPNNSTLFIATPNPQDILVGRGWPYQSFTGNQMLLKLIDEKYLNKFLLTTERIEKSTINMSVVRDMQSSHGSRFLERMSKGWVVTSDESARKKVNSAFRTKVAKIQSSANIDSSSDDDDDPLLSPTAKKTNKTKNSSSNNGNTTTKNVHTLNFDDERDNKDGKRLRYSDSEDF